MSHVKRLVQSQSEADEFVDTLKYQDLLIQLKSSLGRVIRGEDFLKGRILDMPSTPQPIKCGVARILANISNHKESAVSFVESTEIIVSLLSAATSDKNESKCRYQCVRAVRLLTCLGPTFCRALSKQEAPFLLAQLWGSNVCPQLDEDILVSLHNMCGYLSPLKCALQISKSGCAPRMMSEVLEYLNNPPSETTKVKSLFDALLVNSPEFRSSLVIAGAIPKLYQLMQLNNTKMKIELELLRIFSYFARDAFARSDLRETGSLCSLIDGYCDENVTDEYLKRLIVTSFTYFEYDESSLTVLLNHDKYLETVSRDLLKITDSIVSSRCASDVCASSLPPSQGNMPIPSSQGIIPLPLSQGNMPLPPSQDDDQFVRPDSPNLLRLHALLNQQRHSMEGDDNTPLCKDYRRDGFNMQPMSPNYPGPGGSSPQNCASPCYSSNASIGSSLQSTNQEGQYSATPSLIGSHIDTEGGLSIQSSSNTPAKRAKIDRPMRSISPMYKADDPTPGNTLLAILAPVSHKESVLPLLARQDLIKALIKYFTVKPRQQSRAVNILMRLASCRNLTEKLLDINFHTMIWHGFCHVLCAINNSMCEKCDISHKMGCKIMDVFATQVDSAFGMGILRHRIAMAKTLQDKLHYVCAALYLIRMRTFRRYILVDDGCLQFVLDTLKANINDTLITKQIVNAFMAFVPMSVLSEKLRDNKSTINLRDTVSRECHLPTVVSTDTVEFSLDNGKYCGLVFKSVLSTKSEYYAARFRGAFSESMQQVQLPQGASVLTFVFFLHFAHGCTGCPSMSDLDCDFLIDLIGLADELLYPDLKDYCLARISLFRNCSSFAQGLTVSLQLNIDSLFEDTVLFGLRHCSSDQFGQAVQNLQFNSLLDCFARKLLEIFSKFM